MVSAGSHKKAYWRCRKGHEWLATIKSRTEGGNGCPYCSHRQVLAGYNDLASQRPELADEWSERNAPLRPDKVMVFSNRKAWWRCKLGHEWNTLISTRAGGSKCPYCSGLKLMKGFNDLSSCYPELSREWSEKNGRLLPEDVNERSTKNVWWKCGTCGTMTLMKENQRRYRGYPNIRFGGKVLVVINGKTRCFAERWKGHTASTAKRNLYRFCHGCL